MTTQIVINPMDPEVDWIHADDCPCGNCPLRVKDLITQYDEAQKVYDEALVHAFSKKDAEKHLKLTDEQCKLYARLALRKAGFKSLSTYEFLIHEKIKGS